MTAQQAFCDQCDNRCPVDALKCGRGRRKFGMVQQDKAPVDEPKPIQLLRQCGHVLHHGNINGQDLLAVLNEEEQAQLQNLLTRLSEDWKQRFPEHHHEHRGGPRHSSEKE